MIEKLSYKEQYKFGCVISTYNRKEIFQESIKSISESFIPNNFLFVFVDDKSEDVFDYNFNFDHIIIKKNKNHGIAHSLAMGWDLIHLMNIPYMINLDSDVLVSKNWLSKILLVNDIFSQNFSEDFIITGFNGQNHNITEEHSNFFIKNSIGGINLFFSNKLYPTIRRCLTSNSNFPKNKREVVEMEEFYGKNPKIHNMYSGWDWGLVTICKSNNIKMLCTNPSVIQHIGHTGITSTPTFYEKSLDFKFECVPKIIHQTWKDENIPSHLKIMQKSVVKSHSDFDYMFWTDQTIDKFIKDEYPEIYNFYNSIEYIIQKIDFARILIIYHYGGLYVDLDTHCKRPLDVSLLNKPISLARAKKHPKFSSYKEIINNAFILAEKKNIFIRNLLLNIVNEKYPKYKNVGMYKECVKVLCFAGPLLVSDSYFDFEHKEMINALNSHFYYGINDKNFEITELSLNHKIDNEIGIKDLHFLHVHESSWWIDHEGKGKNPDKNTTRVPMEKKIKLKLF